jgi:hypothetical protein
MEWILNKKLQCWIKIAERGKGKRRGQNNIVKAYAYSANTVNGTRDSQEFVVRRGELGFRKLDTAYWSEVENAEQTEFRKKKDGVVCGECGQTVSHSEYSQGQSLCCRADVVAEEDYGKDSR